jgi:AcrR family transcriptional regulator
MDKQRTILHETTGEVKQQGQTTPKRRLGGRSARVRAAVFAATMQVLQERGYELTSVAEIAGRAGVHETSIYRRWGTKEALLVEVALKQTEEAIRVPDMGALRSDLVQFLEEMKKFFQSPLGVALMQLLVSTAGHAELTAARRTFYSMRFAQVRVLFERAVQRGEIKASVNFQLLTETLIGPLYVRQLLTGEPLSRDLPEQIVELILHGVEVAR